VFEARGYILRGINGNVSLTVIIFLFKHSPYFFIAPDTLSLLKPAAPDFS